MDSHSTSKPKLVDLFPQDYEAIARIRERLEINSNALAVRIAIRSLAQRLDGGQAPAQEGQAALDYGRPDELERKEPVEEGSHE